MNCWARVKGDVVVGGVRVTARVDELGCLNSMLFVAGEDAVIMNALVKLQHARDVEIASALHIGRREVRKSLWRLQHEWSFVDVQKVQVDRIGADGNRTGGVETVDVYYVDYKHLVFMNAAVIRSPNGIAGR